MGLVDFEELLHHLNIYFFFCYFVLVLNSILEEYIVLMTVLHLSNSYSKVVILQTKILHMISLLDMMHCHGLN